MRKSYIIDVKAHFKRKPSSIYIFNSYHSPIVKMDLTNKYLSILRTNSSEEVFQISKSGLQLGVTVHEFMLISICQCLCHIMKVSWSHGFIGFLVSMVSWFHVFRGVNGYMVS